MSAPSELNQQACALYQRVLQTLVDADARFLVGGAYAFAVHTGIERHTRDLDLFMQRSDFDAISGLLRRAGWEVELTYPHWLGKVHAQGQTIDLIFNSGNGLTPVDDDWFRHAAHAEVLGVPVRLMPIEEMICSKAFVMERERYDGADVAHLLRTGAARIDWHRLLQRFGPHWRVLLSHLVLYGFVYPSERAQVPAWVPELLIERLRAELCQPAASSGPICQGTLLSRQQYLDDIQRLGYVDGRAVSGGTMTRDEIAAWTAGSLIAAVQACLLYTSPSPRDRG